jgi:hypothetical protein
LLVGKALTVLPVAADKVAAGAQVYEAGVPDAVSHALSPIQTEGRVGEILTIGRGIIFTITGTRTLSVLLSSWVTYQVVIPGDEVEGIGAVNDPTPPMGEVYHLIIPGPVAVNAEAV